MAALIMVSALSRGTLKTEIVPLKKMVNGGVSLLRLSATGLSRLTVGIEGTEFELPAMTDFISSGFILEIVF